MSNNVIVDCAEGLEKPDWIKDVQPFMLKVLDYIKKDGWEISVLFCTDSFIQNLNNEYRQIDAPTDILSFEDGDEFIDEYGNTWISAGDIAISIDTMKKNADSFSENYNEELKRLLIHGILHFKAAVIGEIRPAGQFDLISHTGDLIAPQPFSEYSN